MLQVIHEVRSNQILAWGEGPRAIKITKRICSQDDCTAQTAIAEPLINA